MNGKYSNVHINNGKTEYQIIMVAVNTQAFVLKFLCAIYDFSFIQYEVVKIVKNIVYRHHQEISKAHHKILGYYS